MNQVAFLGASELREEGRQNYTKAVLQYFGKTTIAWNTRYIQCEEFWVECHFNVIIQETWWLQDHYSSAAEQKPHMVLQKGHGGKLILNGRLNRLNTSKKIFLWENTNVMQGNASI